jgi:probable F420-dependent oxidoreductase
MKFTVNIPIDVIEPPEEFQSWEALREMALAIEQAGIDACFVTDHPAPTVEWRNSPEGHDALDPFGALSFVAAATSRLKVHANVVILPYRNPFIVAKAATTLQVLSGGRFVMGVAVGYVREEFEAVGVDPGRRGALANEVLDTLRLIWNGEPVTKRGTSFNAVNVQPRPIPKFSPPIWIGGGSDKAVSRAALYGDGWAPFFGWPGASSAIAESALTSMQELQDKISRLHELRAKTGRSGNFDVILAARHRLKPGTREEADKYIESVKAMADVGVTWTTAQIRGRDRGTYLERVQWFGEEVVSRL